VVLREPGGIYNAIDERVSGPESTAFLDLFDSIST
jgi:hypothetical protein